MKIAMQGSRTPISQERATHMARRVDLALRHCASRVESVAVRLVDLNAASAGRDTSAGRDKRCRITARLAAPAPSVTVEATDTDAFVAVSQAAARLEASVAQSLSLLGREDEPNGSA